MRHRIRGVLLVVGVFVVCALAAPTAALAAIVTWDGGAGTNSWHDAANWSSNTLPAAGDDVVLPTLASSYTVVHSTGTTSVAKVDVGSGATLRVTGGTLVLSGAGAAGSTVAGTIELAGGTIGGAGDVQIDAVFRWFAGTMQGAGTTTVAAAGRAELFPETPIPGDGTRTLSRVLANSGTIDYQDGPLTITSTGQLDNFPTGEVLVSDGTPFICSGCPSDAIANGGTITKDTGSGNAADRGRRARARAMCARSTERCSLVRSASSSASPTPERSTPAPVRCSWSTSSSSTAPPSRAAAPTCA